MTTKNVKSVKDRNDQKLSVVPSLTNFRLSWTFIEIVCCCFISLIIEKNYCLLTLKFKIDREISWWQTYKLIISMNIGRTTRLQFEINPETGWLVAIHTTRKLYSLNMLNAYAMISSLFSTQLSKRNSLFNLDNTLSMTTPNNALQNFLT